MRAVRILIAIIIILASSGLNQAANRSESVKELKIVRMFPSDKQAEEGAYLFQAGHFAIAEKKVYVCDSKEQSIKIFNRNGEYVKQFGRSGQAPGEFSAPVFISYHQGMVYVTDNGSTRIQIFDSEGIYKSSWLSINYMVCVALSGDRALSISPNIKNMGSKSDGVFVIMDLLGNVIRRIPESFDDNTRNANEYVLNNMATIRPSKKGFYLLQMYGTKFREYDLNGNKINEIELNRNPLNDKEYQKINAKYAYPTFDVLDNKIYAAKIARGKIAIDIFDMNGRYSESLQCPLDVNENYIVNDMRVVKEEGITRFYLLELRPENSILVCEIN